MLGHTAIQSFFSNTFSWPDWHTSKGDWRPPSMSCLDLSWWKFTQGVPVGVFVPGSTYYRHPQVEEKSSCLPLCNRFVNASMVDKINCDQLCLATLVYLTHPGETGWCTQPTHAPGPWKRPIGSFLEQLGRIMPRSGSPLLLPWKPTKKVANGSKINNRKRIKRSALETDPQNHGSSNLPCQNCTDEERGAQSYLGCVKVTKNTAHRRVGAGLFLWSPDWSSSWPGSYWWLPCFRTSQAGSLRRSTLSQQKRAAWTVERHHFNWNCGKLTMHVIAVLVLSVL